MSKSDSAKYYSLETGLVITAAGSSSRFGSGRKKEYETLSEGAPVLGRVVETFLNAACFSSIVITVPSGEERFAKSLIQQYLPESSCKTEILFHTPGKAVNGTRDNPLLAVIPGGRSRQESVCLALQFMAEFSPELVLIHDGARPWVSGNLVKGILEAAIQYGACAPVITSEDALKELDDKGFILSHPSRERILRIQTPQGFRFREILKAHLLAREEGLPVLDDTELYHHYHGRVFTIPGERANRKITFPEDLA